MRKKGPKTWRGQMRKELTGNGRKRLDTAIREEFFGVKRKK